MCVILCEAWQGLADPWTLLHLKLSLFSQNPCRVWRCVASGCSLTQKDGISLLASWKSLSWEGSMLMKPEGPWISGSGLNTPWYIASILWGLVFWGRDQVVGSHGTEQMPCLKANTIPTLFEKPVLLIERCLQWIWSQPQERKDWVMRNVRDWN